MLSKYLKGIVRFPDVNDSGGSSASGAGSDAQNNQTDVNSGGDSSASSQSSQEGAKPTLDSVIADVVKSHEATDEKDESESSIRKSNETEKEEGAEVKEEGEASETKTEKEGKTKEEEVEEGKPVPYERFAEVNTKAKEFEAQVQTFEPLARAQQSVISHCQENSITPEQFANWMDIAALVNTDPAKAMERLKPIVESIQGYTGDRLSPDLQAAVDNGDITLDYAKRLAKAENQTKAGEQRVQRMQQSTVEQQERQYVQTMQSSVNKWIEGKRTSDPDFAPKAKETDAHGKYEFFMNEFAAQAKANAGNIKSPQDLIVLAEKSLSIVNNALKGMQPKVKPTTRVSSTIASSSTNGAPKTVEEAMAQAAAKHNISMPGK